MILTGKKLFIELWQIQGRRRRWQFFALLGLMLVATLLEVVSLGAVLSFLGVMTDTERIFTIIEL
jgi:ATP-binding cassette, subfamily B, bacterial PglK